MLKNLLIKYVQRIVTQDGSTYFRNYSISTPKRFFNNSNIKDKRKGKDECNKEEYEQNEKEEENKYLKVDWGLNSNKDIKLIYGDYGDKFFAIDKPVGYPIQSNLNESIESILLDRLSNFRDDLKQKVNNDPDLLIRDKRLKRRLKNLDNIFEKDRPSLYFPSRLDKWTSGILMVATTNTLHAILNQSMPNWEKKYRLLTNIPKCSKSSSSSSSSELLPKTCCLISNNLTERIKYNKGTIQSFIGPKLNPTPYFNQDNNNNINNNNDGNTCEYCKCNKVSYQLNHPFLSPALLHGSCKEKGKNKFEARKAITEYELISIDKEKELAMFNATLKSGRTHQIRIHFSDSGFPILNDPYYNYYFINELLSKSGGGDKKPNNKEMCLQSYYLKFINPTTLQPEVIEIEKPESWENLEDHREI